MKKVLILVVIVFFTFLCNIEAEEFSSGAEVLNIMPSARGNALGNSLVADSSSDALYYNPAGIIQLKQYGVGVGYSSISKQQLMNMSFLGYIEIQKIGIIGLSVLYMDNGDIPLFTYDETSDLITDTGENFQAIDMANRITFARELADKLSGGINLLFVYSKIEEYSDTGFGIDIGLQYQNLVPRLDIGLALKNLGTGLTFIEETSSFPLSMSAGLKYAFTEKPELVNHYLATYGKVTMLSGNHPLGIGVGMEYGLFKMIYVRVGYLINEDNVYTMTFGGGIKHKLGNKYPQLDIAFLPESEFGNKLNISFILNF